MRLFRRAALWVGLLALAGCGAQHHAHPTAAACTPSHSFLGCSLPPPPKNARLSAPNGPKFPDVYEGNGYPNWAQAKPHISMAVVKAWEYRLDSHFYWNVGQLKALHIRWAAYDFVRSCDASGFIGTLRSVGGPQLPPVLDMEVPEAYGCSVPMANQIWQAFHVWPIEYTSPGNNPGGPQANLRAWIATFGPSHKCLPWTCTFVAWQFAAPPWVYYYLPGIGTGDVSVDYGFSKLLPGPPPPPPPPPDPHRLLISPTHLKSLPGGARGGPFASHRYGLLDERLIRLQYIGARPHARYAAYLRHVLEPELGFLARRVAFLACQHPVTFPTPCNWGDRRHFGARFQILLHDSQGKAD